MSSNCGAAPAKRSMAEKTRSTIASAAEPRRIAEDGNQIVFTELIAGRVLRVGHAVGVQHEPVAGRDRHGRLARRAAPAARSPSGVPVEPSRSVSPFARSSRPSTWPALTYRAAPVDGRMSSSAAVTYLFGDVDAYRRSFA